MRGLRRPRRRDGDDSGAVAVMVAVLLTGGVLIGAAALVVDVGGLYAKREQLQAGADAAAWAIAEECIGTDGACTFDAMQTLADDLMAAQVYGPRPGNDTSAAAAAQYCVSWQDCTVAWNTEVACPRDRLTFTDSVEVRTFHRDGDDLIMPAPLAGAFSGEAKGARVGACSRVTWGTPASLPVTALGIARSCVEGAPRYRADLEPDRREELGLAPLRSLPDPPATVPRIPRTGGTDDTCGFVRLSGDLTARDCRIEPEPPELVVPLTDDEAAAGDGPGSVAACRETLTEAAAAGEPVLVPVYDVAAPDPGPDPGEGVIYAAASVPVVGFAALRPTGVCPDDECLDGYFTRVLAPRAQPRFTSEGAQDFGVTLIGRTG